MAAKAYQREVKLFRQHGGGLRMAEALRLGINRKVLYSMRDAGVVEPVSRGVYRLASLEPLAHPDLVTVAKRVPQGVLCLVSALSFHELTTQVPHVIDVALERGKAKPRLDYRTWTDSRRGAPRGPRSERRSSRRTACSSPALPQGYRRWRGSVASTRGSRCAPG